MSRHHSGRERKSERERLVGDLDLAVRRAGRHAVFFHQAVADCLGLSAADSRALSYLEETGPVSAGRLAELTGLTTGAITGMIDRLERAGVVRREPDPEDRRKVIVAPIAESPGRGKAEQLFAPLGKAFLTLTASYSDEQLAIVLEFVNRASDMLRDQTSHVLRTAPSDAET